MLERITSTKCVVMILLLLSLSCKEQDKMPARSEARYFSAQVEIPWHGKTELITGAQLSISTGDKEKIYSPYKVSFNQVCPFYASEKQ